MSKGPFKVTRCNSAQNLEDALNAMFNEGRVPIRHGIIPIATVNEQDSRSCDVTYLITVPAHFVESTDNDFQPIDPRVMNFMKKKNNPSGDSGPSFN